MTDGWSIGSSSYAFAELRNIFRCQIENYFWFLIWTSSSPYTNQHLFLIFSFNIEVSLQKLIKNRLKYISKNVIFVCCSTKFESKCISIFIEWFLEEIGVRVSQKCFAARLPFSKACKPFHPEQCQMKDLRNFRSVITYVFLHSCDFYFTQCTFVHESPKIFRLKTFKVISKIWQRLRHGSVLNKEESILF